MNTDINSLLTGKGINDPAYVKEVFRQAAEYARETGVDPGFTEMLTAETARLAAQTGEGADVTSELTEAVNKSRDLSEMQELIASLDKSILGSVSATLDKDAVASDLMNDPDAGDVVESLVNGHLNGIVLADPDELDEEDDEFESEAGARLRDQTAETLAENLENIIASLGQTIT
ncbi:MAG: hypothetical protein IJ058_11595 [Lachnospiraceae bacterium]|nr:hypothetical protein [Lachnospiraceae bacterium]